MKYKKLLTSAVLLLGGSHAAFAEDSAEKLFNTLCASCHVQSGQTMLAPPIFGVINHVKNAYPNKKDFVERVVQWVKQPNAKETLMPGAVRRFGLMPALPYQEADVRRIAEYLYDGKIALPDWYIEHYTKEHGHAPRQ